MREDELRHGKPDCKVPESREQAEQDAKMEEAIAKATEEIIEKFEEQWKPAMENLQEAEAVFDDLDGEETEHATSSNTLHHLSS